MTLGTECADEAPRLHENLVKALRELDPEDRTLLVQRHVDGISPAELARRAGVSSLVIRKRLSRALTRLRGALGRRLTPDSGRGAQAERARRALLVLSAPRGHRSPAARLAPAASAGLLSTTLFTMGI